MTSEMRQALARETFEEKIRKVGQLIRLVKTFPHRPVALRPVAEILETPPTYKSRNRPPND
jgi:hypothetical protein